MDLWSGPLSSFVRHADRRALASELLAQFHRYHGSAPSPSELKSWEHSLSAAADALRRLHRYEVGVAITPGMVADAPRAAEPGVLLEYHLPLSLRRIDLLLTGHDRQRRPTALVVELKQWSQVHLEDEVASNVRVLGEEQVHPSEQARDYAAWLAGYHGAFTEDEVVATSAAYCHNLAPEAAAALRDPRFDGLLAQSPLFVKGEDEALAEHVGSRVGGGEGMAVLHRVTAAGFRPGRKVLEALNDVLHGHDEWRLLDEQRLAFNAILDEVRRSQRGRGRSAILVRGGPGTGKTVIAVQLLAAAAQNKWKAAHSTGGKAFTTALRSKFKGADGLFIWNLHTRNAAYQGLDLLLVDEAHRVRETSDTRYTKTSERSTRSQARELMDAAKVSVFLLDENQFMRPDEVGSSALIRHEAATAGARLKEFDLRAQFRCGGCTEYVDWVDHLLGFSDKPPRPFGDRYRFELVDDPAGLLALMAQAALEGKSARLVAGFGWPWSDELPDGSLVPDVKLGTWQRPWNRKPNPKKRYTPATHPYTKWAETSEGEAQVGCIYSAQGFEFGRVGVIWTPDLVWRGRWVAQKEASFDQPVRRSKDMEVLVRNAYRVLLTRGIEQTRVLILDEETRAHVAASLAAIIG